MKDTNLARDLLRVEVQTRRQKLKAEMVYKSLNGLTPNHLSSKLIQRSDVITSNNLRVSENKLACQSRSCHEGKGREGKGREERECVTRATLDRLRISLRISLLFPYHVLTITKIALAIVVQSSGTVLPSAARQATSLTNFRRLPINSKTAFM